MKKHIFILVLLLSTSIFSQDNLRVLSWNIQNFGQRKTDTQIEQIASIIMFYDLVAIQQIDTKEQSGEKAIKRLIKFLEQKGGQWGFVLSEPTKTRRKDRERYAFLWKKEQIQVFKPQRVQELQKKVKQEPFVVQISWRDTQINVYNYHAKSFDKQPEKEIEKVFNYIDKSYKSSILMGSFNLHDTHQVFKSYNAVISKNKTLLKNYCRYKEYKRSANDNIYYTDQNLKLLSSGVLDYVGDCENLNIALKISNHLPVVANFNMRKTYLPIVNK
jgi:hypothetical protein